jgi:hypothetical protein
MFTHVMDFFKKHASLKKSILEHFCTSLLIDLSTKDLVILSNLLLTKFMKLKRQLYATLTRQTWVPPKLNNKVLKAPMNR